MDEQGKRAIALLRKNGIKASGDYLEGILLELADGSFVEIYPSQNPHHTTPDSPEPELRIVVR